MNIVAELNSTRFQSAAAAGLRVFPAEPGGKKPAIAWKQFQDRAPTQDELEFWDAGNYNVGIVAGAPSGIIMLDVDSPEAQELVDGLDLPVTPTVRTARGVHYYFRHPGYEIRNSVRIGGVKLDIRGDGGYVVGPGSIHPSGARYEWVISPSEAEFAEMPSALLDLLQPNAGLTVNAHGPAEHPITGGKFARFLRRQLSDARKELSEAEEGKRNDTLFRVAAHLASDVAGADGEWAPFADLLKETALGIGLDKEETEATLASGWKAGSANPTGWMVVAREWVFLNKPNVFYHPPSGQHLSVPAFVNTFARYRVGKLNIADFLLRNDVISNVFDIVYRPEEPAGFLHEDDLVWLNTYRPSGVSAEAGDWSPFERFITYLVPDEDARAHLLKMMAWTVRNPGQKLRHALLLRSEHQGVGKSMLSEIWSELLGRHNVRKTTTEEISSQFQGFIKQTLLVVLEELNWGVGPIGYNRMKDLITADVVPVNEKYLPVRHWPNHATFVILTNLKTPLLIEEADRRIFFIDSPAVPRGKEYYSSFASWWQSSLGVIRAYLDTVDLEGFDPFAPPPMTEAKRALIADSRSELVKELALAIEQRWGVFDRDIVTLAEVEDQLGASMRGKTKAQLIDALKSIGAVSFSQQRVSGHWIGAGFAVQARRASLWAIRNMDYWRLTGTAERAEEYARHEGLFACFDGLALDIRHVSDWPADIPLPVMVRMEQPLTPVALLELLAGEAGRLSGRLTV